MNSSLIFHKQECPFIERCHESQCESDTGKGVARGKGGNPPHSEKGVVEKWCYFRWLYF